MSLTCWRVAVAGMGIPLSLKQSDDDEHDEDKYEEGDREADVQGEVAGGNGGGVLVGVGDDREVSRDCKVGSTEARCARPAVHVLSLKRIVAHLLNTKVQQPTNYLAVSAPVCRGRVGAVPASHLQL